MRFALEWAGYNGYTPLTIANLQEHDDIEKYLLDKGVDKNINTSSADEVHEEKLASDQTPKETKLSTIESTQSTELTDVYKKSLRGVSERFI